MDFEPSNQSAAFAGAWCAFGIVPFEFWMDRHPFDSVLASNALWLIALAVFLAIPIYLFAIGRNAGPFTRTWFLDPVQAAQRAEINRRMFCWFLGSATFGSIWSLALSYLLK